MNLQPRVVFHVVQVTSEVSIHIVGNFTFADVRIAKPKDHAGKEPPVLSTMREATVREQNLALAVIQKRVAKMAAPAVAGPKTATAILCKLFNTRSPSHLKSSI